MKQLQNQIAECNVIGSILLDSIHSLSVCSKNGVTDECFHHNLYRLCYEELKEMAKTVGVQRIDQISFCDWINRRKKDGLFPAIGVAAALDAIIDKTGPSDHCEYYAQELIRAHIRRTAIHEAQVGIEKLSVETEEPRPIISSLVSTFVHLSDPCADNTPQDLHKKYIELREKARSAGHVGLPSFLPDLQNLKCSYIYEEGESVILAARSRVGKTTLAMNDAVYWADECKSPVAIVSLDMSEGALRNRTAAQIAGVNAAKFRTRHWTDEDATKIDEAWDKLNSLPIYITDKRLCIDEIEAYGTMMAVKYGVKAMIVDFIQKVRLTANEWKQPYRQVLGEWVSVISKLGQRMGMATIMLSQLNTRDSEKYADKSPPRPGLGSLKESGGLEENADTVILAYWQPELPMERFSYRFPYWPCRLDVAKNRNGATGEIPVWLHCTRHKFLSKEEGDAKYAVWEVEKAEEGHIA